MGGWVRAGFEPVEAAFAETLAEHAGSGAAVAVWHDGDWVVDLWGGWTDADHSRAWSADTLAMPYSVTKPFAAVCVLLLAERGAVRLDEPIQVHWPELTAAATLRQVLAHRAGLVTLDDPAPEAAFYQWDLMCRLLEGQQPAWTPGEAQGESALFYGHLLGEVVRRVDGRTLGRFLAEEVCGPHRLDFHVGLGQAELGRVADLTSVDTLTSIAVTRSDLYEQALGNPPGVRDPAVVNSERWRRAEIPAVNGHGTARAVAGLYVALQQGELLGEVLLEEMRSGAGEEPDLVMGDVREWGLGVVLDPDGYGMGGTGGSFGWWSEVGGYAFGYVTGDVGDPGRGDRVENALRGVLGLPPV